MVKSYKQSCEDMTRLIESCWDENNPDDGKTFDERLKEKTIHINGMDKEVLKQVIGW